MKFKDYVAALKAGTDLNRADAEAFLSYMLDDEKLSEEQLADALTALTDKTVTIDEVCGFVAAMRGRMVRLPGGADAIDTCGTGGDKSGTFNISTAAAIVLAGGSVPVAKHGNRAATSKCGSADVLEALGVPIDLPPEAAGRALKEHGFVFLFAPQYHPALKRLSIVRRQLGFPTVFNLLGPLLNPAGVKRQIIGTFSIENAKLLAQVMATMDYEHALVLTSQDSLDEASLSAPVDVFEIRGDDISQWGFRASDYGLESAPVSALQGGEDAGQSAQVIVDALAPAAALSPAQRVIVLNAAFGFYVAGAEPSIEAGLQQAIQVLADGRAAAKLVELSNHS